MAEYLLEELRKRIDNLNMEILQALNNRAQLAKRIGDEKKRLKLPILDEDRERQIIDRILVANTGPISDDDLVTVFRQIMRISRKLQQ